MWKLYFHSLLNLNIVCGVGVWIVIRQLGGGQATNRDDGAAHRPREGSDQNKLTISHKSVSQLNQILQGLNFNEWSLCSSMVGSLELWLISKIFIELTPYLKSHGVFHAETIHKVPVVIIYRITISSIEIIIH